MTFVGRRIRVTGIVQGVGFRPFVWRLAQQLQLTGWVRNDALGVEIAAQGTESQFAELLQRLRTEAPPLARIDAVEVREMVADQWTGFAIVSSIRGQSATALSLIHI